MRCKSATPKKALPRCASAAAWVSRCALHETKPGQGTRCAMKYISPQPRTCIERRHPDAAHDRRDHAPHFIWRAKSRQARLFLDVGQTDRFIISLEKT